MIPKKLVLIRLIFIVDGYSLNTQNFSTRLFDGIEAALGVKGFNGYLQGNAMKYLWRYQHKTEGYDKINDLKKCQWYLERLIKEHKRTYSQYEYSKDEMI